MMSQHEVIHTLSTDVDEQRIRQELHLDDSLVFYAFRYCLGRRTYAVSECVTYLVQHWTELKPRTQHQIHQEIREAIQENRAGDVIDIRMWQEVLRLPLTGVMVGPLPTIPREQAVIDVDAVMALINDMAANYPPDLFPATSSPPAAIAGTMARHVCAQLCDRLNDLVAGVVDGVVDGGAS